MSLTYTYASVTNVALPKWPQMLVLGKPIGEALALEIIRRTDTFFTHGYDGNDHQWNDAVREAVGYPKEPENRHELPPGWIREHFEKVEEWTEKWGCIPTEYVHNSWISCAFIHGPHGWCHPDGTISYCDNVGKWPDVEAIAGDWAKIAEAFPMLEIDIALMSGEECEEGQTPVAMIKVRKGNVTVSHPDKTLFADFGTTWQEARKTNSRDLDSGLADLFSNPYRERGISPEVIETWAEEFRATNDNAFKM
jgi:hypothetical protein